MADYTFGEGADALVLRFTADLFGEAARINAGVVEGGAIVGTPGEWVPIDAVRGSPPDTVTLRGDFGPDAGFYVTFLNDAFEGEGADRNVQLLSAAINGVPVEGASAELLGAGDYGPFFFDGNAETPEPEPEPEPVPGVSLRGTAGANRLDGGAGPDTLQGFGGDDALVGGAGDDDLRGGAGSDVLFGDAGDDLLTLNSGRDTVVYSVGDGRDTVVDFDPDADAVWLGGGATVASAGVREAAGGAELFFSGDGASSVIIRGVDPADLGFVTVLA